MPAVVLSDFGGLDLRHDPQQASAVDMLNVDVDTLGVVRTRDGVLEAISDVATGWNWLIPFRASINQMVGIRVSGGTANLDAATGSSPSNVGSWATTRVTSWTALGTPTSSRIYIASEAAFVRKYDGTTLSALVAGKPRFLGVMPTENRLVQAGFSAAGDSPTAANGSESTVFFSDAGAPETYSANNYVHLHPGDGEQITGVCSWQNLLFVFKQTKMFVFYGNSTDSTGNPIFNYRAVVGLTGDITTTSTGGSQVAAASPEGVYFATSEGVFLTNGGPPREVTSAISPAFQNADWIATLSDYQGPTYGGGQIFLSYVNGRLYCSTSSGTFVYDTELGTWLVWSMTLATFLAISIGGFAGRIWTQGHNGTAIGAGYLSRLSPALDFGASFSSRYRTGYMDLGTPGSEKVVREWLVDGTGFIGAGTITFKVGSSDGDLGTGATLTLGTTGNVTQTRDRRSVKGRNFSLQFSSTSDDWSISRVIANVRTIRQTGLDAA